MKQMVNGQIIDVPLDPGGALDSDILRQVAGVAANRPLIMQMPDGTNEIINPGSRIVANPGQFYVDAPVHRRGE